MWSGLQGSVTAMSPKGTRRQFRAGLQAHSKRTPANTLNLLARFSRFEPKLAECTLVCLWFDERENMTCAMVAARQPEKAAFELFDRL